MQDKKNNHLHMNPGAAGISGFHKVRTMLRFEIDKGKIQNLVFWVPLERIKKKKVSSKLKMV